MVRGGKRWRSKVGIALLCAVHLARRGKSPDFVLPPSARAQLPTLEPSTVASTANLAKSIVGAGVLSLPAGAAKVLDAAEQNGYDHSSCVFGLFLLYALFGVLNAAGFYLIGAVCEKTGARTYQEAWSKTLGRLEWLPSTASLVCSFTGMVACISVLGDTASELLTVMAQDSQDYLPKEVLVSTISSFVLLPLCLLPSLSPLAFASVLGLIGVCILALVMTIRCLDGSYAPGGPFYSDVRAVDALSQVTATSAHAIPGNLPFQELVVFAAVLSNAFTAHFNAPSIFNELPAGGSAGGSAGSSRLPQFTIVTLAAFFLSGLLFSAITMTGVETFGMSSGSSILASYSTADPLSWVAKAGLGLCVLFEFPLLERCFRKTMAELCCFPWLEQNFLAVAASVASAVAVALIPGFGLDKSSAIGGALGASFLVYVAPALMALQLRTDTGTATEGSMQRMILQGVVALGTLMGSLGMAEAMQ